jgi:hypothetical protein
MNDPIKDAFHDCDKIFNAVRTKPGFVRGWLKRKPNVKSTVAGDVVTEVLISAFVCAEWPEADYPVATWK